jgi:predicted  nucleic acid-binding Zn-ribbon protein
MSELNTALDNVLIDIFTSENDALARAEFDSLRRADAEKDRLKQKLDDAEAELAAARAETFQVSEALRTREAELDSAVAEIASLSARLAYLDGRIATYAHLESLLIAAKPG